MWRLYGHSLPMPSPFYFSISVFISWHSGIILPLWRVIGKPRVMPSLLCPPSQLWLELMGAFNLDPGAGKFGVWATCCEAEGFGREGRSEEERWSCCINTSLGKLPMFLGMADCIAHKKCTRAFDSSIRDSSNTGEEATGYSLWHPGSGLRRWWKRCIPDYLHGVLEPNWELGRWEW